MKQIFFSILLLVISCSACSKPTENSNGSSSAKVEATVNHQRSEAAIGGEVDPTGFILTDIRWNSLEPSYQYNRVYAAGLLDSSYLNKRVSLSGSLDSIVCMGVERGRRVFPLIKVQQIIILN